MDGLSLLCNLHADGPLALRRLRAAGVHDLGDLEGLPDSTLSAYLRSSSGHARRFVEEARQLARRLAETPLEPEPGGQREEPVSPAPRQEESPAFAWRAAPRAQPARIGGARGLLEQEAIAGLDERTCERLAAKGVRTLEALHERASLALARSAGIPFAKLLDLAAQARLALSPQPAGPRARELVPEAPRRAPALAGRSVAATTFALPRTSATRVHASDPGPAGPFG